MIARRSLAVGLTLALLLGSSLRGLAQSDDGADQDQPDVTADATDVVVADDPTDALALVDATPTPHIFRATSGKVLTTAEATVLAHAVSVLGTRAALQGVPLRTPTPDGE